MSLTTQAFTYAHNNVENFTDFVRDRTSKIIKNPDNDYDKATLFVVFTTFENHMFTPHVLAEPDFHDSTTVDMYDLSVTVLTVTRGKLLVSDRRLTKNYLYGEFEDGLKKAQDLDADADATFQTKDGTVIYINNYDKQLPLKSFLLKTGQDLHKVRAGLDKLIHISSNRPSIVKDMADWYYDKLMEKSLNNFLLDTNYGLDVLNDITERVTYVIQ